jgi:hypothetical protein
MKIENWAYPFESLAPKNDGAKADAAESIDSKRNPVFMVVYDFMDIIIDVMVSQIALVDLELKINIFRLRHNQQADW